jgi:hypothetical protein
VVVEYCGVGLMELKDRDCDICKYKYLSKKCNRCVSSDTLKHSKFKPAPTEIKFTRAETDRTPCVDCDWQGCKTCVSQTIRGYIVGKPSNYRKKEKNMEYKTKEELQSSIEKMEAELTKMKEALKKAEEEDVFWIPAIRSPYYFIESSFYSGYTWMNDDDCSNNRVKFFNCFKTSEECKEAAQDMKTLFMLYRLSRKSMERAEHRSPTYYITEDVKIGQLYNADCSKPILHFASALETQKAIEIIGKENLVELFKKF